MYIFLSSCLYFFSAHPFQKWQGEEGEERGGGVDACDFLRLGGLFRPLGRLGGPLKPS